MSDQVSHKPYPKWWNPKRWILLGAILFVAAIAALFIATRYYVGHPNDTPAFVAGVIGLLTLYAIALQIFVSRMQWEAMREQSSTIKDQGNVMRKQLATMESTLELARRAETQTFAVRGFLLAVQAEINALRKRYEEEDIDVIRALEPGQAYEVYFPIQQQSYFTIYENGASLLGLIPDDQLRQCIVSIYLTARMIIDTHLYNNELLEQRDAVFNERPITDRYNDRLRDANAALADYGYNIRVNYEAIEVLLNEFDECFESVISKLDQL